MTLHVLRAACATAVARTHINHRDLGPEKNDNSFVPTIHTMAYKYIILLLLLLYAHTALRICERVYI